MLELIQGLDETVLLFIQEHLRLELLDGAMKAYTSLGDAGLLWIVLSLLMLCWRPTRRAGALALCAMALGLLCNNMVLKQLVSRPRPHVVVELLRPLLPAPDPDSFPSGHTCAAFAAAGIWLRTLPKRWMGWTAMVMAVLMGLSRLYVGVHFPTDVLVGGLVGTLCALMVWLLYRKATDENGKIKGGH